MPKDKVFASLAEETATPDPQPVGGRKTVEEWAAIKETAPWKFKAAKAGKRWGIGQELTESDYDAAIAWLASPDCVCR